ncbi:MAG: hypothetical protein R3A10_02790 [Caldilineaceae bacterium]
MATQCPPAQDRHVRSVLPAHWLGDLGLPEFHGLLCEHLQDGSAIFMLDGLDEVPVHDDAGPGQAR